MKEAYCVLQCDFTAQLYRVNAVWLHFCGDLVKAM